jgi:hypothetical protein
VRADNAFISHDSGMNARLMPIMTNQNFNGNFQFGAKWL